jgi:hypothetical protein
MMSRYVYWNHNVVHHFTIVHFHDRIEVVARSAVSTHPAAPALASVTDARPYPEPPYPLLDFLAFDGPVRARRDGCSPRSGPPPRSGRGSARS